MRAHEFVTEKKKRRKKSRWAAYGPGPYGGYGFATGYSGDGGGGDGGGVGEAVVNELNVAHTLKFIQQAHGDQLYGKLPYWHHPRAVALTGRKIFGKRFNSDAVKTAFLHDVVEDTHVGLDELRKLDFDPKVIEAVALLTKDKSLSYSDNIKRIIASGNELAQMVKYADNYENYSGDKSDWDTKRADASQKKYLNSLNMLGDHLGVKHHVDEGWKDTLANIGIAGAIAAGGVGGLEVKKAFKNLGSDDKQEIVKQVDNGPVNPKLTLDKNQEKKSEIKKIYIPVTGSEYEVILKKAALKSGIDGTELAAFLSQAAHETLNFKRLSEIGGSLDFRKYDPKYAPKKARALGNTKVGDGEKYKGRGYIQLTGRYNYKRAGEALGLPLEKHPEMVEDPEVAANVAIWFWKKRVQPRVDNFKDVLSVTKPINPGLKGLEDRKEKFQIFKTALK
jgi:predicted chitinase